MRNHQEAAREARRAIRSCSLPEGDGHSGFCALLRPLPRLGPGLRTAIVATAMRAYALAHRFE